MMNENQNTTGGSTIPDNGMPFWFNLLVKMIGCVCGVVTIILGALSCVTITPKCLIAGIIIMICGFMVLVLEVPFCCQFLDFIDKIAKFSETRTPFQKAILYAVLAIIHLPLCVGMANIGATICLIVIAAMYGMIAIGKKADYAAMRQGADDTQMTRLVPNEKSHIGELPNKPQAQTARDYNQRVP